MKYISPEALREAANACECRRYGFLNVGSYQRADDMNFVVGQLLDLANRTKDPPRKKCPNCSERFAAWDEHRNHCPDCGWRA